jgi:hypothetical protein
MNFVGNVLFTQEFEKPPSTNWVPTNLIILVDADGEVAARALKYQAHLAIL